jgi:hypothetical protein
VPGVRQLHDACPAALGPLVQGFFEWRDYKTADGFARCLFTGTFADITRPRGASFPHWKLKTTGVIMPEEDLIALEVQRRLNRVESARSHPMIARLELNHPRLIPVGMIRGGLVGSGHSLLTSAASRNSRLSDFDQ